MATVMQHTATAITEATKLTTVDFATVKPLRSSRAANGIERSCIARDAMNLYGYIMAVGTYTRPWSSSECISHATIFKALKHCITQHHALCTIVEDADTEAPQLRQASLMDLTKHVVTFDAVDDDGPENTLQFLRNAHDLPLHSGHPQWRVIQLPIRSKTEDRILLAFVCSHAFIDGRSTFSFHQTFLQALQDIENIGFDSTPEFATPSNYTVPVAINDSGKLSISKELLQAAKQGPDTDTPFWKGSSTRPEYPGPKFPLYKLELFTISHALIQKSVLACRQQGSKLSALLDHVIARAISRALHRRGQHHTQFACFTPVDLRNTLQYDSNEWGNIVSSNLEVIEVGSTTLDREPLLGSEDWEKIKNTTDLLLQRSKTFVDHVTHLLSYLPSVQNWLLGCLKMPRNESFTLSNVGSFDAPKATDPSAWSIDDMRFSQHSYPAGPVFLFNFASTKNGPLNLTLTWWPGAIGVGDDSQELAFVREMCTDIVLFLESVARDWDDLEQ
ncbi:uncharacterized protein MYCGRDRAFT_93624 [Zymoseptoria tritici IPO323]|uniref:Uncharacterized protein n=1 Tax=Zymoseptoria tritici (strain CBS 115943 / IPO323) TaxID=336722 RepID=F9XE45_ZYMTI|nr:uncharacterized protein MYCGRDRAFT_93624 [Zymoseptoria tritici IPO323]EGP86971.1 hypothetical protein MYCGRDRAFT_93624 [Zymoseptoria tritici IPO323]